MKKNPKPTGQAAAAAAPPQTATRELAVDEVDGLRLENWLLKDAKYGVDVLLLQARLDARRAELRAERAAIQETWQRKYGVDLDQVRKADGVVDRWYVIEPVSPPPTGAAEGTTCPSPTPTA